MYFAPRTILLTSLVMILAILPAQSQVASMHLLTDANGWALDSHRLFWTSDGAGHWKEITPPQHADESITDVFFLDSSHGWALLCGEQESDDKLSFRLAITADSGKSWTVASVGVATQRPDELDGHGWLDFVDPSHGWMVLHANSSSAFSWGLLLTTYDGGKNWRELPQAPIAGRPVFATSQDGWISGNGGSKGMYSTHDGGMNWQADGPPFDKLPASLPTNPGYGDVRFTNSRDGFVLIHLSPANDAEEPKGTAVVLYVTEDSGQTWKMDRTLTDRGALTKTGAALSRLVSSSVTADGSMIVAFNDRKNLNRVTLMAISHGENTSTDSANSTRSEGVLWRHGDDVSALSFASITRGWALTSLGDLLSTKDSGATWKNVNPIPVVRPSVVPTTTGPRVKARRIGSGPSLLPQSPQAGLHYTERLGFEEHNVTTVATMGTWFSMSPFFDTGIYVGGANYCGQKLSGKCVSRPDPGLTPLWVTQMEGQGWGFLPIWVGPQAPCVNATGYAIFNPSNAAALGKSNADNAATAMAALGLADTVVFYDMEGYSPVAGDGCSAAVRAFLNAWVQEMNADGFATTAVYGNPGNAQNDFSSIAGLTQAWISITPAAGKPPAVTIWGLGAGKSYALGDNWWPTGQRAHQFLEGVGSTTNGFVTYGGVNTGLPIDYDVENLLIPGSQGNKDYTWVATTIIYGGGANGINDVLSSTNPAFVSAGQLGEVVGWYSASAAGCTGGATRGFLDSLGTIVSFYDPSGPCDTIPVGVNSASQVGGVYGNSSIYLNGFWGTPSANSYTPINVEPPDSGSNAINDDGQIAGVSDTGPYPYLYFNGQSNELYISCAGNQSYVSSFLGINGFSEVAGIYIDNEDISHSFVYDYETPTGNGACIPLGSAPGGDAIGTNNQGQVLGIGAYTDGWLFDNGVYYSLPQPFDNMFFYGINDAGQIVGEYQGSPCPVSQVACGFILNPE